MRFYVIVVLTALYLLSQAYSIPAQERGAADNGPLAAEIQEKEKTAAGPEKQQQKPGVEQSYNIEPVVVTATRTATPLSEVTKSIDVVTNKDLETQQQTFIPEALNIVPGVIVQNQGGPGQYSPVNIRGVGSGYVQFQFNGFPLRDAADFQTSFQAFEGDLYGQSGINRIEVLNGTNSVLYGSQAIGGVVNIIPQRWQTGFSGEVMTEVGPHTTFIENGGFSYGQNNYYVNAYPLYTTTNGISNGFPTGYWFNNVGFIGGAGVKFGNNMALEVCNITSSSDMASGTNFGQVYLNAQHQLIPNQASSTDHAESFFDLTGLTFTQQVSPEWDYSIKAAYGATERQYFYIENSPSGWDKFDGTTTFIEMQHNIRPTEWLTLTAGFDYDDATYSSILPYSGIYLPYNTSWFGYDLFGQAQTAFFDRSLFVNAGLRFNDHEDFRSKVVEEVSAAYIFKQTGTKIHTAFGTGYRTPSLYEMYGGAVAPNGSGQVVSTGNPNLKPENSTSYEVGVTQPLIDNKLQMGITWFHIESDNMITYDYYTDNYTNAQKGKSEGIEAKLEAKPCKYFSLTASYTYINSLFIPPGSNEWTRSWYWPMDTFALIGTIYPMDRLCVSLKVLWEGDRTIPLYDTNYNEVYWREPGDWRVDMVTTYKILKNYGQIKDIDIFLKITNLFDEHYTESGYQMPGRWIWGGLKMTF